MPGSLGPSYEEATAKLWEELLPFKKGGYSTGVSGDHRTFWAGLDNPKAVVDHIIALARHSAVLSMFGYADTAHNKGLREKAENEHVYVQESLDSSQYRTVKTMRELVAEWPTESLGTSISIGTSIHGAISHVKGLIVDGWIVVGGSTNWSTSGQEKQDNELVVYCSPSLATEYRTRFDAIHDHQLAQMQKHGIVVEETHTNEPTAPAPKSVDDLKRPAR